MPFHAGWELRTALSQAVVLIGSFLTLAIIGSAMGLRQHREALSDHTNRRRDYFVEPNSFSALSDSTNNFEAIKETFEEIKSTR